MRSLRFSMACSVILFQLGCQAGRLEAPKKSPLVLTDANFNREVLESPQAVFVEMWSATCEKCRAMEPIVRDLADEFDGRVEVGALNVDSNRFTAEKVGVEALPVFFVFYKGQTVERLEGVQTKQELVRRIDSVLKERGKTEVLTNSSIPSMGEGSDESN